MGLAFGARKMMIVCALASSLVAGCSTSSSEPDVGGAESRGTQPLNSPMVTEPGGANSTPEAAAGSAARALDGLRVAGRGPMTGYSRVQFGPAWADVDRNGCDTRNDILARDLRSKTYKPRTRDCVVLSGTLADPYTVRRIPFVRGGPSEIDVDHVVALGNSWVTGAARMPYPKRVALANDRLNLLAVDASANRQKGDGDAATWLPPNKAFRCAYVATQIGVKAKYGLYVTAPEKRAMDKVLSSCPDQPVATGGGRVDSGFTNAPTPVTTPAGPRIGASSDPRFATCAAAKAAGYGPYVSGTNVEFAWYSDRDRDGVVCE